MGCDIHIVVERKKKWRDKWVGLYSSDAAYPIIRKNMIAAQRDYAFFGVVAAVRGDGVAGKKNYPRNLPEDMSDLTREQFWQAPTDYHSPSYMTPKEFTECWLAANADKPEWMAQKGVRPDYAAYDLLGIDPTERDEEYRVVFWFDN